MSPDFLSGLNERQLEAVTLPHQSALILAGAGSGKTRVLTTRVAWLIQTGQASPHGLLAVTFTNKAAKEMLTRISAMLPINTRGMWVGTFHGLCNRLLRAHHREAGLPQQFQILDSQDQLSLIKRLLKSLNVDEERFPPRQVQWFVSAAKDEGLRAPRVEAHDEFTRRMKDLYGAYDDQCRREGVVDFAELLLRSYELLSAHPALRDHYCARFRHVLVDEFQDTNRLQYAWLKLLAGALPAHGGVSPLKARESNAIFAVGDDDQCVAEGTLVTMADGTQKAIERVKPGDQLLSAFGTGDFRLATVRRTYRRTRHDGLISIHTRNGRRLTTTPEHTHFAGYVPKATPQAFYTYLMFKRGIGYRLGTTQVYTRGQARPMLGFKQRALQEHADALWVVSVHATENEARVDETVLSLRYGLPTLPFTPRKGGSKNGLVHDRALIRKVFDCVDTGASAQRLLADLGLDKNEPHHLPQSRNSNRRNITVVLCGDRRGIEPWHRMSIYGNDRAGRRALEAAGFSVRPAKKGSRSWRFETCRNDFGKLMRIATKAKQVLDGTLILKANLNGKSLPFVRAASIRPGMVLVDGAGRFDVVERVGREAARSRRVYDLDVHPTHNFIANGLVTHNSIYAFRGATSANMQDLQKDFAIERVIKLEQNYRSHGHILDAANALIQHNRRRLGKNLWTAEAKGEPLRVFEAATDFEEASFVVDEARALRAEGVALAQIAVLYRSNAQSRVIEHALFSAGVPYRVYGGLRFFERQEVKHALAYLRLVAGLADDGALTRVINFPARGIGARSLEQLQEEARAGGGSLWETALHKAQGTRNKAQGAEGEACGSALSTQHSAPGKGIPAFVALIGQMREATKNLPLPEVIEHVIEASGLKAHYRAEREGADRLENLAELINAAATFVAERDVQPAGEAAGVDEPDELSAFLSHAALEAGEHQAVAGADALQLMTVHSAKGLEFHSVFVSGLEEGLFPHENSLTEADGIEEERRLMYVALTRARRRLYLSLAQSRMLHGQTRYGIASRFFREIPENLLRRINPGYAIRDTGYETRPGGRKPAAAHLQPATRIPDPDSPWKVGQSVVHATFGAGVIVNSEGRGPDARVQVNFRKGGLKWLALEYAKLIPA